MSNRRASTKRVRTAVAGLILLFLLPSAGSGNENVVAAAKKEGRLVIYGTQATNILNKFVQAFNQEYPFLKVDTYRSGTQKFLTRAVAEAGAGKYIPDIFSTSIENLHILKSKNLLAKYISPESANYPADVKDGQGFWTLPYMHSRVVAYNTKLVSPTEAPRRYADLLDSKWKGKIGLPMRRYAWFGNQLEIRGEEDGIAFFKKLAAQDLQYHNGLTLCANLLAAGEFAILALVSNNTIENLKDQGAPVEWFYARPVINILSGPAVAANAPHPNAGRLYIDFLLSRKGQELIRSLHYIPNHVAVEPDPPRMLLKGEKRYFEDYAIYEKLDHYTRLYKTIFKQ